MNGSDLTTGSISKHIRAIAIPATIGFFFNTMYNVVDTFYAGLLSTTALAALSLSFPIFFTIIALCVGLSTGLTALISHALGKKDENGAKLYAAQGISFGIILSVLTAIIGFFSAPYLFTLLGAEGEYLRLSLDYINIILIGIVFFMISYIMNSGLTAQGDTKTIRNAFMIGFFLNIILDPWFMFGGLGLPAMGVKGIALATVIIQLLLIFYMAIKVSKTGLIDRSTISMLRPRLAPYKEIFKQGIPAGLNMMTVAIGVFIITYFVSPFGQQAVAAYGIGTRIEQLAFIPSIGLNIATIALVGQNAGAGNFRRVEEAIKKNLKYGLIITSITAPLTFILAPYIMRIFSADPEVIAIGSGFLRIDALVFSAYMILYLYVFALQGLKKPLFPLLIGFFRQIAAPIAIFWLLAHILDLGLIGIWWGIFIITWTAAITTYIYARRIIRRMQEATEKPLNTEYYHKV